LRIAVWLVGEYGKSFDNDRPASRNECRTAGRRAFSERAKARAGWKVFEIEAGHDIMIDAPAQLAEILSGLD
jgi:hypothetical protein